MFQVGWTQCISIRILMLGLFQQSGNEAVTTGAKTLISPVLIVNGILTALLMLGCALCRARRAL
jgi:hypothetical protein